MKFFKFQMENSKLMLTQFAPKTADPHSHDHGSEYQLSIPLIGSALIQLRDQVGTIADRQRVVTAPHEQHFHFANEEASRLLLINLKQEFVEAVYQDRVQREAGSIEFVPWTEGPTDGFRKIADQIIKQSMTLSLEKTELQQLEWELANLLLESQAGSHTEALRGQQTGAGMKHPAVRRVLDLMHDDFAADLSLDELARLSGLSKYHLIRLFREQMGSTPSHYLSEVRLERAVWLLNQTQRDVTSIAFEVGFGSLSAFERAFKRKYGVSANEYRKLK
jgi:AraC family transcriptional regulator